MTAETAGPPFEKALHARADVTQVNAEQWDEPKFLPLTLERILLHVTHHNAIHMGQIVFTTKMLREGAIRDLKLLQQSVEWSKQNIADSVQDTLRESLNERPALAEGVDKSEWILLDYFNFVVHVFSRECRAFYALERLWGTAERHEIS